jgi:hypothetical protein
MSAADSPPFVVVGNIDVDFHFLLGFHIVSRNCKTVFHNMEKFLEASVKSPLRGRNGLGVPKISRSSKRRRDAAGSGGGGRRGKLPGRKVGKYMRNESI